MGQITDPSYLIHTDTGRASKSGHDSPIDLIYRYDGTEVGDLLDAADNVFSSWERGDLAGAVRELEHRAKIVRETV